MNIAVAMAVAGHEKYFYFASKSIPTFLHNCPGTELLVFTDRTARIKDMAPWATRLHAIEYETYFRATPMGRIKELSTFNQKCPGYFDASYNHNHVIVAALLPMAQAWAARHLPWATHLIKIDCDAFFAGGNLMARVAEDVQADPDYDLWLVERTHPLMGRDGMGRPGVGFTMWTAGGPFIPTYIERFNGNEQSTILKLRSRVRTKLLTHPGYHFVFPFHAGQAKIAYTKEQLATVLPAYFHVHLESEFDQLESWFGGVK